MPIVDSAPRTVPYVPALAGRFRQVRAQTESLCVPLEAEDMVVASMADVSPTKWHLAHTSWFFETFVLSQYAPQYVTIEPRYSFLFNSYYVQAGERHCRAQRGLVTRPTVAEVFAYRRHVDEAMHELLERIAADQAHPAWPVIELGIQHEQQHQELLLTDIKHVFWTNPMRPTYRERAPATGTAPALNWNEFDEGVQWIGHEDGFAFDNEGPRHRVFVEAYRLASRLVTNGEYLAFIEDRGYHRPELWLSAGWSALRERNWSAPLYWEHRKDHWREFTLAGDGALELAAPVTHLSYFEAEAYARWAGHRLPTEAEWEIAAVGQKLDGHFVEGGRYHPAPATALGLSQLFGEAWQWTRSAYVAYPGYVPPAGAIGEYNGKWMSDQWVLRGASSATPRSHARHTYRNFFPSDARWQFTGVRLAAAL